MTLTAVGEASRLPLLMFQNTERMRNERKLILSFERFDPNPSNI